MLEQSSQLYSINTIIEKISLLSIQSLIKYILCHGWLLPLFAPNFHAHNALGKSKHCTKEDCLHFLHFIHRNVHRNNYYYAKSSERFAVEKKGENVNQSVSGLILLNKPNTELSWFIKGKKQKKTRKMVRAARFEPRSPAWPLAMLPIEPRKHSTGVVYCTYLTHFRTRQLWYTFISCENK